MAKRYQAYLCHTHVMTDDLDGVIASTDVIAVYGCKG